MSAVASRISNWFLILGFTANSVTAVTKHAAPLMACLPNGMFGSKSSVYGRTAVSARHHGNSSSLHTHHGLLNQPDRAFMPGDICQAFYSVC